MDKLYTIPEAAEYGGVSESKVRRAANSGDLAGQIVAGTYIFTEASVDTWLLGLKPKQPRPLLTVNTASRDYNVSKNRLYTLLQKGALPAIKIKARGGFGWAYVFTEDDLLAVGKGLEQVPSGPAVKDNVDDHLERSNGRWAIKGTKDKYGKPLSYRNKNQARRRAREAYGEPPLYQKGDSVFIKPKNGHMQEVVLLEDVTWIDQAILVRRNNSKTALLPLSWLWSKK